MNKLVSIVDIIAFREIDFQFDMRDDVEVILSELSQSLAD